MKAKTKPKVMWAFWASASYGNYYKTPQKVILSSEWWWTEDWKWWAEKPGLEKSAGYCCYADPDKKKVQQFALGFLACREVLMPFFDDSKQPSND